MPTRLVAGLFILKHMHNLSDEALCERWVENPYFQYFCGEAVFRVQRVDLWPALPLLLMANPQRESEQWFPDRNGPGGCESARRHQRRQVLRVKKIPGSGGPY